MKVFRYIAFVPIDVALTATAWLFAPWLAAWSVLAGINVLPGRWQWWSTVDNTLDGWYDQGSYPASRKSRMWLWWYRTCWIFRNPAYGWSTYLLGCSVSSVQYLRQVGSDTSIETTYYIATSPEGYWCVRGLLRLGIIGIRFGFGWKLTQGNNPRQFVFSLALRR